MSTDGNGGRQDRIADEALAGQIELVGGERAGSRPAHDGGTCPTHGAAEDGRAGCDGDRRGVGATRTLRDDTDEELVRGFIVVAGNQLGDRTNRRVAGRVGQQGHVAGRSKRGAGPEHNIAQVVGHVEVEAAIGSGDATNQCRAIATRNDLLDADKKIVQTKLHGNLSAGMMTCI